MTSKPTYNTVPEADASSAMFLANRIMQNIFIGCGMAAEDEDFVFSNEIGCILNCAGPEITRCFVGSGVKYLTLNWKDDPTAKIFDSRGEVVSKIVQFISDAVQRDTTVLVASRDGMSRSVIALAVYLTVRYRWQPRRALQFIATKRVGCNPAMPLVRSLIQWSHDYEKELKAKGDAKEPCFKDIFGEMSREDQKQLSPEELLHRCTFQNALNNQDQPRELQLRKGLPDFLRVAANEGLLRPTKALSTTLRYLTKRRVHWSDGRTAGQVNPLNAESALFRPSAADYTSRVPKECVPHAASYTLVPRISEGFEMNELDGAARGRYQTLVGYSGDGQERASSRVKGARSFVPPPFSILLSIPTDGSLSLGEGNGEMLDAHVYPRCSVFVRDNEYIAMLSRQQEGEGGGTKDVRREERSVRPTQREREKESGATSATRSSLLGSTGVSVVPSARLSASAVVSVPSGGVNASSISSLSSRLAMSAAGESNSDSSRDTNNTGGVGLGSRTSNVTASWQTPTVPRASGVQPLYAGVGAVTVTGATGGSGSSSGGIIGQSSSATGPSVGISKIPKYQPGHQPRVSTKYRPPTPPRKSEASDAAQSDNNNNNNNCNNMNAASPTITRLPTQFSTGVQGSQGSSSSRKTVNGFDAPTSYSSRPSMSTVPTLTAPLSNSSARGFQMAPTVTQNDRQRPRPTVNASMVSGSSGSVASVIGGHSTRGILSSSYTHTQGGNSLLTPGYQSRIPSIPIYDTTGKKISTRPSSASTRTSARAGTGVGSAAVTGNALTPSGPRTTRTSGVLGSLTGSSSNRPTRPVSAGVGQGTRTRPTSSTLDILMGRSGAAGRNGNGVTGLGYSNGSRIGK